MQYVSRTVDHGGNSFEMFYDVIGNKLILKDVIPQERGTSLPDDIANKFHQETVESMTTYGKIDPSNAEDMIYVNALADKGIVIIDDPDDEETED